MTPPRPAQLTRAPIATAMPSSALPIRLTLGFVYLLFGALKLFPDLSPAEVLAEQTILRLHLGISADGALFALALFECTIGLLFWGWWSPRLTVAIFYVHMAGTLLPLLLLPELTFTMAPFAPNFDGQYILKNLVLIATGPALLAGSHTDGDAP